MFLLKQWLPAAAIAVAVSALISAIANAWTTGRVQNALAGFAVAAGYICGHFFVTGRVSVPPTDTTNWLPIFALAAAAFGSGLPFLANRPARRLVAGLLSVGALRLLLQPKFSYAWSNGEGWIWVISLGLAVVLLVSAVDALTRRSSMRFETPVLLMIACAGTSGALILSGTLLLGQFAIVLAAALAGLLALGLRGAADHETTALVFSLLLIALLVSGYFFAELPPASGVLLGVAPAFALTPMPVSGRLRVLAARITLTAAAVGIALFLAFRASPALDY
jgi:hypothetical protein